MPPKQPRRATRKGDDTQPEEAVTAELSPEAQSAEPPPKKSKKAAAASIVEAPLPIARTPTPRPEKVDGLVVGHWNIAGLNGLLKSAERKERFLALLREEDPDVLAISEHKLSEAKAAAGIQELMALCPAYKAHWAICTAKNGYAGVGVLVKRGLKVLRTEIDAICTLNEGRTVMLELEDIFVVATYVPNSGQDLKRLDFRIDIWDPALREYISNLQKTKPVCAIGDFNVAHLDIDIWNVTAKHIPKSAGTTPRERESFGKLLEDVELVDAFRVLHPDATGCFTYWSTRAGNQNINRGLRLDYALLSKALASDGAAGSLRLHFCDAQKEYAPNGDHCPTLVGLKRT